MAAGLLLLLAALSPLLALGSAILLVAVVILRRQVNMLAREARQDPLTGLPNRRGLTRAWDRLPPPRALLFVDLIGFKGVNDRLGHAMGDALLVAVARRLGAAVPRPGTLARWGGDEFVALVPAHRVEIQTELLRNAAIMGHDLGGPASARVHIGVTIVAVTGALNLEDAIRQASQALLAKKADATNGGTVQTAFTPDRSL